MDHGDDYPGSGGRDWMAEAAPAAVDVDDRLVKPELANGRDGNGAERLVDLEQVDVASWLGGERPRYDARV
jgi:hypothetical protein